MVEPAGHLITGPSQFQSNLPVGRFVAERRTQGGEGWHTREEGNERRRRMVKGL